MKSLVILFFLYLLSNNCYSQLLEGSWKGSCTIDYNGREIYSYSPIELDFVLSKDSIYSVYSYSLGHTARKKDMKVTCKVYYQLFAKDSVYLEEIELTDPPDANPKCLRKMYLKIVTKKNKINLEGVWEYYTNQCAAYGSIILWRKNKY